MLSAKVLRCPSLRAHSFLLAPSVIQYGSPRGFALMAMSFSWSGSLVLIYYELKLFQAYITCLSSFNSFPLSILAAISRIISGGAIPLNIGTLSIGCKHLVINLIVKFNAISTFLVWNDCHHTGHAYSPTHKHRTRSYVLTTFGQHLIPLPR